MASIKQQLGGTTAEEDALTRPVRVISVDVTRNELRLGDGITEGGHRFPNFSTLSEVFLLKANGLDEEVGFPNSGVGILIRLVDGTFTLRELTVGDGLLVDSGDGVAADPELSIDPDWLDDYVTDITATEADILSGATSKLIPIDAVFAAGAYVPLTHGTPTLIDFATGWNFKVTATASTTIDSPTNVKVQSGVLEISVIGSNRVITLDADWVDTTGLFPITLSEGNTVYASYLVNSDGFPVIVGLTGE